MTINRIRGEVFARYPSIADFARAVGWSRQKASTVVNLSNEPSLQDVQDMAKALEMDTTLVASFFLPTPSQKCD